tara:strand:+ start:130 stop:567 length:438 start_codon:yes stop_codon:yes gene_type:complete
MNILAVCFANYCRSPVVEAILNEKLPEDYKVSSAGIRAVSLASMDKRSHNFLLDSGYRPKIHIPRNLNSKIIKESDLIYVMDAFMIDYLYKFRVTRTKDVKLFNFLDLSVDISDPHNLKDLAKYNKIMKNLESLAIINSKYINEK